MDISLRNARLADDPTTMLDIGVADGAIVALQTGLTPGVRDVDLDGRLVCAGFIETHIHLDKACILDRCRIERGDLSEAVAETARLKASFTEEDVAERAAKALRKCILNGATRMRTHVEVDPVIGLRGLAGVRRALTAHDWALDAQICVFPQEGLLNYPGVEPLLIEAMESGVPVIGGAPYTDTDPHGQIDRIFEIARRYDADIDFHLDFSLDPETPDAPLDAEYVCAKTEAAGWGGRVTIGHVSRLSMLTPDRLAAIGDRLAQAGVAVTALPATDLFLMGRDRDHAVPRGVAPLHRLAERGVTCALSTNNLLNPFTPYGDGSLIRMANLYANNAQLGRLSELADCFRMITERSATLMRLDDYGVRVGAPADLVVLDHQDPALAVAELAPPLMGFKAGKQTFERPAARLLHP
ncbi:MAG: amidohydrolase family protein [Alphaproteobacteria bacterium]|nr:amidohydrolase family protein [Alphaproteobacteria bacterium]